MRNIALVFLVFVAGCGLTHQPRLASEPSDKEIYQKDLESCRSWAFDKMQEIASYDKDCQRMGSAFGLVGALVACEKKDQHPEAHKNVMMLTDECISKKGYKVLGLE